MSSIPTVLNAFRSFLELIQNNSALLIFVLAIAAFAVVWMALKVAHAAVSKK